MVIGWALRDSHRLWKTFEVFSYQDCN